MPCSESCEPFGPDDGRRLEAVGDGPHGKLGDEFLSPGIVHVDDRGDAFVVQEEELLLGLEVVLHGVVVIQVLAAQVREDGDVEAHPPDPLLLEGVGGDLHQAMGGAGLDHLARASCWMSGASGVVLGRLEPGSRGPR